MQGGLFFITTYQLKVNHRKSMCFVRKSQHHGINNKMICQIGQQTCNQNNNQNNCLSTVLHKNWNLFLRFCQIKIYLVDT